jgi:uncharacterized repeat protein (TIGR01451 family)
MRLLVATAASLAAISLAVLSGAPSAFASQAWDLQSQSNTTVQPGGELGYIVQATNMGISSTDGSEIVFAATLPAGITAVSASVFGSSSGETYACTAGDGVTPVAGASSVKCVDTDSVEHFGGLDFQLLSLTVTVGSGVLGTFASSFSVSGGGDAAASTVDPTRIGAPAGFGIDTFDTGFFDQAGVPVTQAGGHPASSLTSLDINVGTGAGALQGSGFPVAPLRDVHVELPPGLVGFQTAAAECTGPQLAGERGGLGPQPLCPAESQIGTIDVRIKGNTNETEIAGPVPVYNMVPPAGEPVRFGFDVMGSIVYLNAHVRTGGDYGVSIDSLTPEALPVTGFTLDLWGVPSAAAHDGERACPGQVQPWLEGPTCPSSAPEAAFLRNPTSCTAPGVGLSTEARIDSWSHPGVFDSRSLVSHSSPGYPFPVSQWGGPLGIDGCEQVPFGPSLSVAPEEATPGATSAFSVGLSLPQSSDPSSIGEGDLRNATVVMPAGVRVNPSSAAGLEACSEAQIDLSGAGAPSCPNASKLGTISVETPLLREKLGGSIYLATPYQNKFGSLLALYLVIEGNGVVVKLPARVDTDASTGQLTTVVEENPQLPFSNLRLNFFGGPRSALVTPSRCGTYAAHGTFTSWSGKTVETQSSFALSGDGHGAPCAAPRFAPSLSAGTSVPSAGAFSSFGLELSRTDADEELGALSALSLPPGLLADAASVPVRCSEAQAAAAACPAASHIGTVSVGSGAGPNPFYVPGDVYLMGRFGAGPFKGDPFGLAVVVHALAGPFDLGYVVVRSGIHINDDGSITAQTEQFPQILKGIPLQLRDIRVRLDRPGFTFNPTSCGAMPVAASVSSTEALTASLSSPFQASGCSHLAFHPSFSASTQGNGTFNHNGASFDVKLATGQGPGSHEANIHKVEVELPKALPARLTTLQKACTETQFATNPAGCPVASNVGTVIAHTPILAAPLAGPAYLVSHGGAAFPDLVLVLQGEGIVLHVTGHTQIKKGITYSRFETVPDAPISSFELKLPEGPFSALAANANLCQTTMTKTVRKRITVRVKGRSVKRTISLKSTVTTPLAMPTTITAQNGAVINQTTKIAVTGCAKVVKAKTKKTKAKKNGKGGRRK